MSKDTKVAGLEQYAPGWSLKAAGALLVLTLALNNVGINFSPVMQAWTAKIASDIEAKECVVPKLINLEPRLEIVESMAHEAK